MNIPESLLDKMVADSAVAYDCHCIQDVRRFEIKSHICDKSNCRFRKGLVAAIESLEETHNITEKSASENSYSIGNMSVRNGTSFCSRSFIIKEGEIHEVKIGDSVIATVTISKSEGGGIPHSYAGGSGSSDPPKGGIGGNGGQPFGGGSGGVGSGFTAGGLGGPGRFGITSGMIINGPVEQHSGSDGNDTERLSITITGIGDGMGGPGRQSSDRLRHPIRFGEDDDRITPMDLAVGDLTWLPIRLKWWERLIPNNWGRTHKKKIHIITSIVPGD